MFFKINEFYFFNFSFDGFLFIIYFFDMIIMTFF
jgi:hypothetical protein